ncbi:MAG: NAD-dependent epimerase/dehydratase family protein [Spirochaetes bacterium]|nr:NAD-dependent epimerase/dehydratase family protein [Spirochaetota bacterium]
MKKNTTINLCITGAAGNLGGLLARHLVDNREIRLFLMVHHRDVDQSLKDNGEVTVMRADLARKETLVPVLKDIDVVVHFAGVLFKSNPEKFLHITNIEYFENLVDSCIHNGVKRIILISFPHVEGESSHTNPARGRLDAVPESVHAATRLEEERYLFSNESTGQYEAVSLRVGMVYGKGILMIDAARWLSRHCLLGVWRKPTWIHLISKIDFLDSLESAVVKPGIGGIYHVGDEGIQTLQEFLDTVTAYWGYRKPWRLPLFLIYCAAALCEFVSRLLNIRSPLTRDFITIGRVSYYGDTSRMRRELLAGLKYRNYKEGIETF